MNFLSFQTLLHKNSILLKIKVSYEFFKIKVGILYIGVHRHLFMSKCVLKSDKNQLTSADIGPKFVNLVEIKHMGHVFHSVLGTELEFEGKNNNFSKSNNTSKILSNFKNLTLMTIF